MSPRLRWAYLVPQAAVLSLFYRWASRRATFPQLMERLQARQWSPDERRDAPTRRRPAPPMVAKAVDLATSKWPLQTTCLIRSLALARLLRPFGYRPSVVIGASEEGTRKSARFAHAWVEVADSSYIPGYREIVRFKM